MDEKDMKDHNPQATEDNHPARIFTVDELTTFGIDLLTAVGADPEEAKAVTTELVTADMAGHPSHGVMRLLQYVRFMEEGMIKPGARLTVVRESLGVDVFDGHYGFGQYLMRELLEIAYSKARRYGTYTAFARDFNHVGRLGSYAEDAARNGFLAMMMVNVNGMPRVATYGAAEPRLGTNPICIAMPNGEHPIMVDTTTCMTAEGKVRIAMQNNDRLPDGQIIDKDGNPTNIPADYYTIPGGAILPLGGPVGYKGSGLAIMVEMMCGILSGAGFGRTDVAHGTNAVWLNLVDLTQVIDVDQLEAQTTRFVAFIKSARPLAGTEEVLLPGEPEHRRTESAKVDGTTIPGGTWSQLQALAEARGVTAPNGTVCT